MRQQALTRVHLILVEMRNLLEEADLSRSDAFIQHGDTSCLLHCVAVAFYAAALLDVLGVSYDRRALVRGALLHDFFLYDWHDHPRIPGERRHAFSHPGIALANARSCVRLTPKEENIILRHMFPVTLIPPSCREGLAVCLADKGCALYEGLRRNTYPGLRRMYCKMLKNNEKAD